MAPIGETELDVRALWRALRRRAWLIALLTIAAGIATFVGLGFLRPLYTADTGILIEERESPLTRPREDSAAPSVDYDVSAIQSQVEVVKSREIAETVIDKLDLTRRPEFDPGRDPSVLRSLLILLGVSESPAEATIRQRVMDSYYKHLSVYPLLQSRVIGVEFTAPNPGLAAEVANAISDAFIELQQNAKRESAVAATEWLQQEIERLRGRVAEAEQAVADYRQKHGLFVIDQNGSASGDLSTQQLGDINAELARARAARAEAEARAQLVGNLLQEGSLDASEEVLNSPLIQRLRERQGALQAQIAELSTTLLPTHPQIRALREQLTALNGQIRDEVAKVLESLKTAARVAAAREDSLLKSLNEAKGAVSLSNDQAIELRALEREAAAQRDLLESFLSRYREASARTDANYLPADARVISRAVVPIEPSFPKRKMMAIAAAITVLLLASVIMLLREFMSGRAFRVVGERLVVTESAPARPPAATDEITKTPAAAVARTPAKDEVQPSIIAVPEPEPVPVPAPVAAAPEPEPREDVRVVPVPVPLPAPPASALAEEPPSVEKVADDEHDVGASDMALATELLDTLPQRSVERERTEEDLEHVAVEEVLPSAGETAPIEAPRPGTAGLGDLLANASMRLALFVGAEGGEGAGAIAFSAARQAAKHKVRCVVIDAGHAASNVLGHERPGFGELLTGDAAFGEVIQRDETARVHVIPLGGLTSETPMERMRLVIGALTHTYDKVIVVADKIDDWPDEYFRPDLAAIVCGPDTTESLRTELYDFVLARGAHSAIIVRYTSDFDLGEEESAAA